MFGPVGDISDLALTGAALLMAGAAAGFAGGLFGIGGGFVVVPALVFLLPLMGAGAEQTAHVAVGTSLATIIFTSIRSTMSHAKRDSVDFDLLKGWAPWVVLGTAAGAWIADFVSGAQLAMIFGVGVLGFAVYFLLPARAAEPIFAAMPAGVARVGIAGTLGAFSALLGIGGGTLTTLTMTVCGAPIHRAIGTAAGMGAIIAIPGAVGFAVIGWGEAGLPWGSLGYVNLPAALGIVVTSIIFAPLGVAVAHNLAPQVLRRVFGIYLIVVGITMIAKF
ncbi:permease [Erythrobacter sp. KY5]|uniref:sulfite exporter TauE/SafE family protein n=1 Tax=Erythrobacter sp. KY5 TaxID=2011159 RepID=UPI000DBF36EA|nr:sulfite exporter TauE/SafE family protein [Erythrobacter sp. KY5]AWW75578.1 permease [Erythrobacter sp. KY5]